MPSYGGIPVNGHVQGGWLLGKSLELTELPNTRINCCYFHFTQSLWKKFSGTGLVSAYRSNSRSGKRLCACVLQQ